MTKITLGPNLGEALMQTLSPLEVCDASGAVIGTFTPKLDIDAIEREANVDYDELIRRLREDKFITTKELLARLDIT